MEFSSPKTLYDHFDNSLTFKSSRSLITFLEQQKAKWERFNRKYNYSGVFLNSAPKINNILASLAEPIQNNNVKAVEAYIESHLGVNSAFKREFLLFESKEGRYLRSLIRDNILPRNQYNDFSKRISSKSNPLQLRTYDQLKPEILALLLSDLKIQDILSKQQASAQIEDALYDINEAKIKINDESDIHIETLEKIVKESEEESEKTKVLNSDLLAKNTEKANKLIEKWTSRISELEKTYEEKLRLKKPAEYWEKSARKHERHVTMASMILTVVVAISAGFLGSFFMTWLQGEQLKLDIGSFQGAIIFGVLIAVLAFVLKLLSRIIFSSLHLARDAEEREQLTYVYLALENDSKLSEEERQLILTSIFSRSETGLLTNEHGPTLPISDIVRSTRTP